MKKTNRFLLVIFIIFFTSSLSLGASPYTLSRPLVVKLDWNIRGLTGADVNADGLNDLLVINNAKAKIDVLYQSDGSHPPPDMERIIRKNRWEPLLSDAKFYNDPFVTGQNVFALAAGDLNGDGKIDIAYTGDIMPLTVCFQGADGTFSTQWTFDHLEPLKSKFTIFVFDLDKDGKNELVVMAQRRIFIFDQSEGESLKKTKTLRLSSIKNFHLMLTDIDGDNKTDLAYFMKGDISHLVVRLQKAAKNFGPESVIDLKKDIYPLIPFSSASHAKAFAGIASQTGMIRTFELKKKAPDRIPGICLDIYSGDISLNNGAVYSVGDFNGDGLRDIAVADPGGAKILVYLRRPDDSGFMEAKSYPSLASIDAIDSIETRDGSPDALLVVSGKEEVAGVSVFDLRKNRRLEFPALMRTKAKPVTGAAINTGRKTGDDIVLFEKKGDSDYLLELIAANADDFSDSLFRRKVHDIHREPESIFVMDLDGDGMEDIMLLIPREPARVFRQTRRGRFSETAIDSAVRRGVLNDLRKSRIGRGDMNDDGKDELLVSSDGYVRALKLDENGNFIVLDQYNSADAGSALYAPVIADIDGDGKKELLVYGGASQSMELFERDSDNMFRSDRFIPIPAVDLVYGILAGGTDSSELLYFGSDRFLDLRFTEKVWAPDDIAPPYETNLKDVAYTKIAAGNFHAGSGADFVAIDGKSHVLDLLSFDESQGLASKLFFTIFDENQEYGRRRRSGAPEPREMLVGDFTGNGLDDIVFLIHDRVLIYPQKGQ
ncbi:MAG: VCBS repeat-containing protein [Deltaproteobacteria bacterium]|nr:VCBS repeat-containing protein [Deltaproteobacteria bacterium]